jgi:hypothetical protein
METDRQFVNIHNPAVVVTVLGHGQYRLGETRRSVTIYERRGALYVRNTEEFNRIFRPLTKPPQ